jgi:PAS domain S-box-containing protein
MDKKSMKILLIEDNPGDARLLREMFFDQVSFLIQVTHVESIREAEKHIAKQTIDVIVLDLGLPDAHGLEALRRAHLAGPYIPSVVLTGLDDEALAVQALKEGAQDYLIKGQIETHSLMRALRYAIERKVMEIDIDNDVTRLKRAEAELRESELMLRLALDVSGQGVWRWEVGQGTDKLEWDHRCKSLFGLAPDTLMSYSVWASAISPGDRVTAEAGMTRALDPADMLDDYVSEYRVVHPDGVVSWVSATGRAVFQPDPTETAGRRIVRILGTIRDVSQAKWAEQEREGHQRALRQAQKMEAIGNLSGGMAHDFNNMLGVIIGNLDLAVPLIKDNHDVAELVEEAIGAALSSAELTRRLLAFARKQSLRAERIAPNDLISGIVRLLRRTLGGNIEIVLDLADDLWPVIGDPAQFEASLTNLATNARDAMPNGGQLSIATVNRCLDADYAAANVEATAGDYAAIVVSDTGAGMAPEIAQHIFEPFFTTKEPGKGTGLGLSMVFGFIKQSGGHISIHSEPSVGTTFRLYLPRAAGETAQTAELQHPLLLPGVGPLRGAGESVLAVEDDPRLRQVVVRQLSELGYRPIEADRPAAALEILEREQIDLLFTDVVMPGPIDGIALAQQVIERWPTIKVLLTSGFAGSKFDEQFDSRGTPMRLISKPYRVEDLAKMLRQILTGGPADSSKSRRLNWQRS